MRRDALTEVSSEAQEDRFAAGVRACLPVVLGYLVIGLAFGVVARTAGLSAAEVGLMSLVLYAGSAQFVVVGLLGTGVNPAAIAATVFLVNVRHLLYSAALAPHLGRLPIWKALLLGAEITDETFAVASGYVGAGGRLDPSWLFGLNLTAQSTWIAATVTGALVGDTIPNTRALGLDFALAAMFAALLVLQVANRPHVRSAVMVALLGAGVGVGGALIVPAGWAIIAAALVAATAGALLESRAG